MKEIVCFITAHLPSQNATQAGQKIVYNHLKWLHLKYDIILISFANKEELNYYNKEEYLFCKEIKIIYVSNARRAYKAITHPLDPLIITFRESNKVKKYINEICTKYNKVIFWLEYTQMGIYIPSVILKNYKIIIVCHDVLKQMFQRRKENSKIFKIFYMIEEARIRAWELKILKKCDCIIVLSAKDKSIIKSNYNVENIKVFSPKIDFYQCNSWVKKDLKEKNIIFFGAMNRVENEIAVLEFVDKVFRELLVTEKSIKFIIVGSNPSLKIKKLSNAFPNIVVTGFVINPNVIFTHAWFSVALMKLGAGIKIKVLECLAAGVPVVTTSVGAEGIDATRDDGLFVEDNINLYIQTCKQLLNNRELCLDLATKSKEWFKNSYLDKVENEISICKLASDIGD